VSVATITTVPGTACTLVVSRVDLAVGPFVGPNQAVLGRIGPITTRPRRYRILPICRYFRARRRHERHASHAMSRRLRRSQHSVMPRRRQQAMLDRRARGIQLGPRTPGRPRGTRIIARGRGCRPRRSRGRAETPRVSVAGCERKTRLRDHRPPRACLRSGDDAQKRAARAAEPDASSRAGHLSAEELSDGTPPAQALRRVLAPFAPTTGDIERVRHGRTLALSHEGQPEPVMCLLGSS
jgi:hypothetical protein